MEKCSSQINQSTEVVIPTSPISAKVGVLATQKKRQTSSLDGVWCLDVSGWKLGSMVGTWLQVVPGRAGGGSFKRKKNYIAKKEFAYRMCARWPTIAMSKFFSEVWTKLLPLHGCHVMRFGVMCLWFDLLSNDAASCEVICGTTPTYYSSTTLYSVLQSTTPVLLCTTKYYSSTTLYYKVLLQYYSPVLQRTTLYYKVLQSTTPVLLCTTKYYSSTTLYYKVLQGTTPVLLCTTKFYSSTTLYYASTTTYYSVLQSTTKYYSSTTLYYKVLLQYYSVLQSTTPVLLQYHSVLQSTTPVLQSTTPVLLCTTKYYNVLLQYYSVLKSTTPVLLQYYSVLQSTTPVLLCTTKYYSVRQSTTPVLLCTRKYYNVLLQYYSVLQSTTPVPLCTTKYYASTTLYYASTTTYYSGTTLKRNLQCAAQQESASNFTKYCACHAKWMSSMICVTYETSFPMRGASQVTLQPHQILRLPRKMNVINDLRHIWNRISNAWSKWSHPPTSPNTAPATQSECHQWSASHMKPHFQCAEQVKPPSNLTKYCACHAKWMSSMICVTYATSFPMRGATKVTLQPHQILRLPRNLEAQDFIGNSLKCFRQ